MLTEEWTNAIIEKVSWDKVGLYNKKLDAYDTVVRVKFRYESKNPRIDVFRDFISVIVDPDTLNVIGIEKGH